MFDKGFLDYMESFRFSCDVDAVAEGSIVFPNEPLIRVQGPIMEAQVIETLLLNMIYHGRISSMPYSLSMFDGRIQLIRPLMDLDEKLLVEYAALNDLVKVEKSCPHEKFAQRRTIARLIKEVETIHGPGPYNIFNSMGKISPEYLPSNNEPGS